MPLALPPSQARSNGVGGEGLLLAELHGLLLALHGSRQLR